MNFSDFWHTVVVLYCMYYATLFTLDSLKKKNKELNENIVDISSSVDEYSKNMKKIRKEKESPESTTDVIEEGDKAAITNDGEEILVECNGGYPAINMKEMIISSSQNNIFSDINLNFQT